MKRLLIAILWATFLAIGYAGAHEAPAGWAYDMDCCSDKDCRPLSLIEVNSIRQTPEGYQATLDGFAAPVVFYQNKIRPSKDQYFHGCVGSSGVGYCLYVPLGV